MRGQEGWGALCIYAQVPVAQGSTNSHSTPFTVPRLLEQGIHSDVVFVVHGKRFRAHRCILRARSTYFANMLDTKWKGKSMVVLRHPLVCPSG